MAWISQKLRNDLITRIFYRNPRTKLGLLLVAISGVLISLQAPMLIQLLDYARSGTSDNDIGASQWVILVLALLLLGFGLYLLIKEFFGYSQRKQFLDTHAIRALDEYTSPDDLNLFLHQRLLANQSFSINQVGYLEDYFHILELDENILRNKRLRLLQEQMVVELEDLTDFMGNHFSPAGPGAGNMIRLCPNLPTHHPIYQAEREVLIRKVNKFVITHQKFRKTLYRKIPDYSTRA